MTCSSFVASILLATALSTFSALGQGATPGPEHEILKKLEGTWTAKIIMEGSESTGTQTYKMTCGGLWLASEFKGEFAGMPFEGRGTDGYDAEKKKYVSVWVDSMSLRPLLLEGTYDKAKKTMTMTGEGPGPDGKPTKHKMVTHSPDDDHQTFTMFMVGADGQETKMMTIQYTRKK
jgi:hypothetical protein